MPNRARHQNAVSFGRCSEPIDLGDLLEHRAEQVVLGDIGVEAAHQLLHLARIVEVPRRNRADHFDAHASG